MSPSAFAGVVRLDGAPVGAELESEVARAVARLRNPPRHTIRTDGAVVFGERAPGSNGALFAASAHLDNREELADALGLRAADVDDAELLQGMLARWGDEGLGRCLGAFAFAQWEPAARRLTLGRDCLGERALFFHQGDGFVAFATALNLMLALPDVPRELDERVLANYLALNLTDARRTFYRAIDRVPSRMLATFEPAGVRLRHYWSPSLAAPAFKREADYVERARELLDLAVASATRDTPRIAISTSGGLDSSSVAATAARLGQAEQITCYSLVAPADFDLGAGRFKYVDERSKVLALGRMHPALELRLLCPDRPHPQEENDARLFLRSGAPILNPTNGGFFGFLHDAVAGDGHAVMQVGHSGNFGLTWAGHFSLASLARRGDWAAFTRELSILARETDRTVLRTFLSEVVLRGAPPHVIALIHRLRGRDPDSPARHSLLSRAYIADHQLGAAWREAGFDPRFVESARDPAAYRASFLFDRNQFARDNRASAYEQHGFEIRDPHGDRRLLEFCLGVPEPMYRQRGVGRSFARAVLADRLPPEIVGERRTGMQDAQWFSRLDQRRAQIGEQVERLAASPTASRLLDLPRLKRLVDQWPADAEAAQGRMQDYRLALSRGLHVGNFIRWVEGGNG
jgi:asparagine synthase (glutamine-hydrolysing)